MPMPPDLNTKCPRITKPKNRPPRLPRPPRSVDQIPRDRWVEPGTPTFEILVPDLAWRYKAGLIGATKARQLAMRALRAIVKRILERRGRADEQTIEDILHDLLIRLAIMDVPKRYDSRKSAPLTFVNGVAQFVVHEALSRRKPPRPHGSDALDRVQTSGDQLDRMEREEMLATLRTLIEALSDGERRVLFEHYAPPPEFPWPAPNRGRRRGNSPSTLPDIIEILDSLRRKAAQS